MKRIARAALVLVLGIGAIFTMVGCSGGDPEGFVGKWVLSQFVVEEDGDVYTDEDFVEIGSSGAEVLTMVLNSDGTVTFTSNGTDPTDGTSLTWYESEDGTSVIISNDEGYAFEIPYDSSTDTLTISYGGQTMTMVRG